MPSATANATLEKVADALRAVDSVSAGVDDLRSLTDAQLLRLNKMHTRGARSWGALGATIAGELAHRSRPELGPDGLARRTGYRTVEVLLKNTTGATREQVQTAVAAGTLVIEAADDGTIDVATGEIREASQPWLRAVAELVGAGRISTSASQAITRGLGKPSSAVSAAQLERAAAEVLTHAVAGVDADRLGRMARDLRNEIDLAAVAVREAEHFAARGITHFALPNGRGRAIVDMDPANYARFVDIYDRATSPKRGGVRFIDPGKAAQAKAIEEDPRSIKQIAFDAIINRIFTGGQANHRAILGGGPAVIRVTIAEKALQTGIGFGRIDGQTELISITAVKNLLKGGKVIRMGFDPYGGYREDADDPAANNRLYSRKQHEILAAKFGGCMDPDCERPPSWC
jgi:hypothetical protein